MPIDKTTKLEIMFVITQTINIVISPPFTKAPAAGTIPTAGKTGEMPGHFERMAARFFGERRVCCQSVNVEKNILEDTKPHYRAAIEKR